MIGDLKRIAVTYLGHEYKYKAYIAGSKESQAFDHAYGNTPSNAMGAVKRRNSPDWEDCYVWVVYIGNKGQEEKI